MSPKDLPGSRIKTHHVLAGPADENLSARLADHHRCRIRGVVVQGSPFLHAGLLVQCHQAGAFGCPDLHEDQVATDERGGRYSPHRHAEFVVHARLLLPEQPAGSGIQAVQVPHRAQRIDPTIVNRDGGAGPGRVSHFLIGTVVRVAPKRAARLPMETEDAFDFSGFRLPIREVNASLGDRGTAIAASNGRPPAQGNPRGRELLDDPRLLPNPVARGSAPLRPLCRP